MSIRLFSPLSFFFFLLFLLLFLCLLLLLLRRPFSLHSHISTCKIYVAKSCLLIADVVQLVSSSHLLFKSRISLVFSLVHHRCLLRHEKVFLPFTLGHTHIKCLLVNYIKSTMINNTLVSQEQQQRQQSVHLTSPSTNRVRSHSVKPQQIKEDYVRRKSATDVPSASAIRLELSTDLSDHEHTNTPPPRRTSPAWFRRRFTLFSLEHEDLASNQPRRATTARFSFFDHHKTSQSLKRRRPSIVSQMVEVFSTFLK